MNRKKVKMITKENYIIKKIVKPDINQKNPFKKWGIKKISPTSFNLWAEHVPSWILKYILKIDQEPSLKMYMGSTAESVLYKILMGFLNLDQIDKECENEFIIKAGIMGTQDERHNVLREVIGYKTYGAKNKTTGIAPVKKDYKGFVRVAYDLLKNFGKPEAYQVHVKFPLKYFGIDADGYKDFSYQGFDIDLKTTTKMQGALPLNFRRQLALYKMQNDNRGQKLLLATKEKAQLYVLEENYKESKEEIYHILNTMAVALSECNSVEELLIRYYPNWEFWKLSLKQREELRKHIQNTHKVSWQQKQEFKEFERACP